MVFVYVRERGWVRAGDSKTVYARDRDGDWVRVLVMEMKHTETELTAEWLCTVKKDGETGEERAVLPFLLGQGSFILAEFGVL